MTNGLNRDIKQGEKVALLPGVLKREIDTEEHRIVTVVGNNFGNHAFTIGTALTVEFWDGEIGKIDGFDLARVATEQLQADHQEQVNNEASKELSEMAKTLNDNGEYGKAEIVEGAAKRLLKK